MMTEVYADINQTMLYYKNADSSRLGAHFTFNFITFIDNTHKGFTAIDIVSNIFGFIGELPEKCIANWVVSNRKFWILSYFSSIEVRKSFLIFPFQKNGRRYMFSILQVLIFLFLHQNEVI